jgi:hypothetical protein
VGEGGGGGGGGEGTAAPSLSVREASERRPALRVEARVGGDVVGQGGYVARCGRPGAVPLGSKGA